jgi:hypothetical protein
MVQISYYIADDVVAYVKEAFISPLQLPRILQSNPPPVRLTLYPLNLKPAVIRNARFHSLGRGICAAVGLFFRLFLFSFLTIALPAQTNIPMITAITPTTIT